MKLAGLATLSPLLLLAISTGCRKTKIVDPVDAMAMTDPRVGSGGGGFAQGQAFVGAALPLGMIRPGPDTTGPLLGRVGFAHTSGYWALDDRIDGFSQMHVHGTGVEAQGQLLLMPTDGPGKAKRRENGYGSRFDPATEEASPGRYAVTLVPSGIRAELSATLRVALHRYTFPSTVNEPTLVLDAGHGLGRDGSLGGALSVDASTGRVSGKILATGRFTGADRAYDLYFVFTFSPAPSAFTLFDDEDLQPGATTTSGVRIGAFASFPAGTERVEVKAAVSLVSAEGALKNLASAAGQDFDSVRFTARERWRDRLQTIEIWGGTPAEQRTFYSALYHALLLPTRYDDLDGLSVGLDGVARPFAPFYSDLSLWDTYRTLHPLFDLLWPGDAAKIGESLLEMNDRLGHLPRWPLLMNPTGTMIGAPASIVLADGLLKGVIFDQEGDPDRAWRVLQAESDLEAPRPNHGEHARCAQVGFCPADEIGGSVSKAVEYGWADFAVGQVARARGDDTLGETLEIRARLFTRHYDPAAGFLRGKNADGSWSDPAFDPTAWDDAYVEGNAWQYLFAAPYDPGALIAMVGSREGLLDRVDELFELSEATPPKVLGTEPFFEPDPYYWHGNEPDLHLPYLYALMGEPGRGARWIDWVRTRHYDDTPSGLAGNDDAGTLSAWYVFSALGLYPLAGSDLYLIGTPLFEKAVLHLPGGDLTILAEPEQKGSLRGHRVAAVFLDEVPLVDGWLRHDQIAGGGTLRFVMGPAQTDPATAAPEWGAGRPWSPVPAR